MNLILVLQNKHKCHLEILEFFKSTIMLIESIRIIEYVIFHNSPDSNPEGLSSTCVISIVYPDSISLMIDVVLSGSV